MSVQLIAIVAVAGLYAVLAAVTNMAIYAALSRHVALAAGVGVVLGGMAIAGGVVIGEPLFTMTLGDMKALVVAAGAGALLGHVSTITTVEPGHR